jgi:hypothetical protein
MDPKIKLVKFHQNEVLKKIILLWQKMKKDQLQPKAIYVYQYLKFLYFQGLLKLSIVKVRFLTEQSPAFFFFLKE